MSDPSLPLQAAIVAALKNANVAGRRIYDEVPPNATFPYVSLGDGQVLPDKADCIDGTEVFPQIDVWSRKQGAGYEEAKAIGAAVIAALDDQSLSVTGYTTVLFELQSAQYLRDSDGKTRHGVLTFHALLQAA